jgi:tripartite-type tricarboxylate transporter receptor subunit TctC
VPHLQANSLKAIAVTSKQRFPSFPNVPALAETAGFGDVDFTNWFGLLVPAGTPAAVRDKLAKAAAEALKDPKVREILQTQAAQPVGNTPQEFSTFIRTEAEKYGKVAEITGLKVK